MGLDQYLTAKLYLSNFNKEDKEKKDEINVLFRDLDLEVTQIEFTIHQWRKSNAIHKWFVDNVQDGNDNCGTYYVSEEKLKELLEIINKILNIPKKEKLANSLKEEYETYENDLLPTEGGFFFGSTDYDEYYIKDLIETKEMLEKILNEKYKDLSFYYSSSW